MRRRTIVAILAMLTLAFAVTPAGAGVGNGKRPGHLVDIQILALNDFHGNLVSGGTLTLADETRVPAGGAAYVASLVRAKETENPNTVFVSAGDLIGASPLVSALFHDEPTIEAMNLMGLDANAVGNHEFDEGREELLRMQTGGCHPVDGCLDGDGFGGAEFPFLAANVVDEATGDTLFPPYEIVRFEKGVRVAFIGMTLEGTPTIVTPSGVAGLDFRDEADTVNALVDRLKPQADIVVVLLHEGGVPGPGSGFDGCNGISGPVVDIVERTSDEVDLFITGHTHQSYICEIDDRPVTSTNAFGRLLTDIDLTYDVASKEIVSTTIDNVPVLQEDIVPAADVDALVDRYVTLAAPLENRVIGSITESLTRTTNAAGESALGDVIADSQLEATDDPGFGEAVVAFMNPGGIRADLTFDSPTGSAGEVTYGEIFTVQPFGNSLVTMTLTGAQIDTLLEQQWLEQPFPRILQVSEGFSYTWSAGAPDGSKVDIGSITINGTPVNPTGTYRVTVNSFLADGGDNFTVLLEGTDRLGGAQDLDAVEAYFAAHSPVSPGPQDRITVVP